MDYKAFALHVMLASGCSPFDTISVYSVANKREFYLLKTKTLDDQVGAQKTISLSGLLKLDPIKTQYDGLAEAVHRLMDQDNS